MIDNRNIVKNPTIVVIVEGLEGGLKAARFVLKHLHKDNQRFVLLQVYKVHGGMFLMRNLPLILKNISMEDLRRLKDKLIEEFGIESDKIEKMAAEGSIDEVLNNRFRKEKNIIAVIGEASLSEEINMNKKYILPITKKTEVKSILYIDDSAINNPDHTIEKVFGKKQNMKRKIQELR